MTAGNFYDKYVFCVQISGPKNLDLAIYKNLHLGDSLAQVEAALGRSTNQNSYKEDGHNYTAMWFAGGRISAEMKDGVLSSFYVSEDPNFFQE